MASCASDALHHRVGKKGCSCPLLRLIWGAPEVLRPFGSSNLTDHTRARMLHEGIGSTGGGWLSSLGDRPKSHSRRYGLRGIGQDATPDSSENRLGQTVGQARGAKIEANRADSLRLLSSMRAVFFRASSPRQTGPIDLSAKPSRAGRGE
jgi:hypothetical protein